MLRSSRTVVSLIRSLVLGTATTTTATVMVASLLVGCKDESQPEFWVEKLSDASWKARAVKRLEQFFEDAATWPPFGNMSLSGYERSRVYLNRGVAGWVDVAERVGVNDLYDGRAVALADLSNRGTVDVIVANQNQPAILYRNKPDSANHWIGFKLVGTRSNRSAIGAEVTIESGDFVQRRVVDGGSGFASQNDRRPHFGLGKREWVDRVVVEWPSGARQVLARPPIDQIVTITEPAR